MQRDGVLLLVHGEVTDTEVDVFDREAVFIDRLIAAAAPRLPRSLKVVFEHITTKDAAQYVAGRRRATRRPPSPRTTCCTTATPSSLAWPAAALLLPAGAQARGAPPGARRKRRPRAAPAFFLGTDSAPHAARAEGGVGLRRRLLHGARSAGAVRGGVRRGRCARPARGVSPATTAPTFYGLPAQSTRRVTLRRERLDPARDACRSAKRVLQPLRGGETLALAAGRLRSLACGTTNPASRC